jgi:hypothetical protein
MTAFQFLLAFSIGVIFGVFVMGMMRMARLGEDDPAEVEITTDAKGNIIALMCTENVSITRRDGVSDWTHAATKRPHVQD